jgi:hypothetical protein
MLQRHAVFIGTVYFDCGAACSYRLRQVNSEGFVEQYPVASVPAKCTIQQLVKKWFSTGSVSSACEPRNPSTHLTDTDTKTRLLFHAPPSIWIYVILFKCFSFLYITYFTFRGKYLSTVVMVTCYNTSVYFTFG